MPQAALFQIQMILGYAAWVLCFGAYAWPRLTAMDRIDAHRAIATLHGFRFFGLVFILPGMVGPGLPAAFAQAAAYGDLTTALLALLALAFVRVRPAFWFFIVVFNVVGLGDLLLAYYHAIRSGLPEVAGQLGAAYAIPILYVPLLMTSHIAAFCLLLRPVPAKQTAR